MQERKSALWRKTVRNAAVEYSSIDQMRTAAARKSPPDVTLAGLESRAEFLNSIDQIMFLNSGLSRSGIKNFL